MLNKLILTIIFIFSISTGFIQAEVGSPSKIKNTQRLEWVRDKNVLIYKVEIKSGSNEDSLFFSTEENFVETSLPPGTYRYRVYAYDMLGREASISNWTAFDIEKAVYPEIKNVQSELEIAHADEKTNSKSKKSKNTETVQITAELHNVSDSAKIELINDDSGKVVRGTTSAIGVLVDTDELTDGNWRIKITNPGGFSSESEKSFIVRYVPSPEIATSKKHEEKTFVFDQGTAENFIKETMKERPGEILITRADNEELNFYIEKKREWFIPPHTFSNINILVGAGYAFAPYTIDLIRKTSKSPTDLSVRFSTFSALKNRNRYGFELKFSTTAFNFHNVESVIYSKNSFSIPTSRSKGRLQGTTFSTMCFNLVWQRSIYKDSVFFAFKGGAGLSAMAKENLKAYSLGNAESHGIRAFYKGSLGTVYPAAMTGVSMYFTPIKIITIETGCDLTNVFIPNNPTGLLCPYVSLGIHF